MLSGIPGEIYQFGMAGLMFIVWYATFKMSNQSFVKVSKDSNETISHLAEKSSNSYETAIKDSQKMNETLLNLLRETAKEEQEVKTHLIRTLMRIEEKLDQPVRCPAHIMQNRTGSE